MGRHTSGIWIIIILLLLGEVLIGEGLKMVRIRGEWEIYG